MASGSKKKPQLQKRQSEVGRLFRRDKHGRFIKVSTVSIQRRDKFGRFAKTNRFGLVKQQPARKRDEYGRFIAAASKSPQKRDKHGRFVKQSSAWWRRRAAIATPLVIFGVSGTIYFIFQLNRPIFIEEPVAAASLPAPAVNVPVPDVTIALQASEPTRLRISKIGVDTSFVSIGKKADGTMEVPGRYDIVGWYDKAPTPGELGPAIVVGHVDRPGGIAVFWRLRELVPGDTFEIDRADGSTVKFKVNEVKQLPQDSFPTEEVYGNIDHAGIRLITCGGTFDRKIRQYSHNTVVYGSLIIEDKTVSYTTP